MVFCDASEFSHAQILYGIVSARDFLCVASGPRYPGATVTKDALWPRMRGAGGTMSEKEGEKVLCYCLHSRMVSVHIRLACLKTT